METTTAITVRVRGYVLTITPEGDDCDVIVSKAGKTVVVGMFSYGLTLSDYSPTGEKVSLRESLVDAFEEKIEEALEGDTDEDDSDDE